MKLEYSKLDNSIRGRDDVPGIPVKRAKNNDAKENENLKTSAGPSKHAEDTEMDSESTNTTSLKDNIFEILADLLVKINMPPVIYKDHQAIIKTCKINQKPASVRRFRNILHRRTNKNISFKEDYQKLREKLKKENVEYRGRKKF